jgi:hypothetical protein
MLAVVEHQEHLGIAQGFDERLFERLGGRFQDSRHRAEPMRDKMGVGYLRQLH